MKTEQDIKDELMAADAIGQINSNTTSRDSFTLAIRGIVFIRLGVSKAFFKILGNFGVRFLLKSRTSIADANSQRAFDAMSITDSLLCAQRVAQLEAENPILPMDENLTEAEKEAEHKAQHAEAIAQNVYWSGVLNSCRDSPHSDKPKFKLTGQPDGNVVVSDYSENE